MNLDTFILIVVPVVAWLLIKRFLRSLLVSWLIGVPFLWLNMARHETRAPAFESPLIFVLAMEYRATLLIAFNAMVVTTAWALRCIWRDGWEEGGRCDSTRQCERSPPAATPGSGTITRYGSLRTSEQVALFGSVIVCLYLAVAVAVEFGGLLGGLAMVGMYSVGVLVTYVRMDTSRAWAVATLTRSVVPFVLLAVALIIDAYLPFELRTSQPWQDVVDAFYVASLMASGPLGILVTLAAEENFPRDGIGFMAPC
jgi:hypothetical protein